MARLAQARLGEGFPRSALDQAFVELHRLRAASEPQEERTDLVLPFGARRIGQQAGEIQAVAGREIGDAVEAGAAAVGVLHGS